MTDINEIRRTRGKLINRCRELLDSAQRRGKDVTGTEKAEYDENMKEIDALARQIEKEEGLRQLELALAQPINNVRMPEPAGNYYPNQRIANPQQRYMPVLAMEDPFERYLRYGLTGISMAERRALSAGSDISGGYLAAPEIFDNQVIMGLGVESELYNLVKRFDLPRAHSFAAAVLSDEGTDAEWTIELSAGVEDTGMAFGKRMMTPHPLGKFIKVSNRLLAISGSADVVVREALTRKFAAAIEAAICTGSGAGRPLGLFTASANGINTDRDFVIGSATAIDADKLVGATFQLPGAYLKRARWIFSRAAMNQIRTLKTSGGGDYILQSGLGATPTTLLGLPLIVSEYCPATLTAGLYVGMLGCFEYYWLCQQRPFEIKVADQLYLATDQTGYFTRTEIDGAPVLPAAFRRLKMADA